MKQKDKTTPSIIKGTIAGYASKYGCRMVYQKNPKDDRIIIYLLKTPFSNGSYPCVKDEKYSITPICTDAGLWINITIKGEVDPHKFVSSMAQVLDKEIAEKYASKEGVPISRAILNHICRNGGFITIKDRNNPDKNMIGISNGKVSWDEKNGRDAIGLYMCVVRGNFIGRGLPGITHAEGKDGMLWVGIDQGKLVVLKSTPSEIASFFEVYSQDESYLDTPLLANNITHGCHGCIHEHNETCDIHDMHILQCGWCYEYESKK